MIVQFIVNGQPADVCTEPDAPLVVPKYRALRLTRNTGRRADEWELRTETGEYVDDDQLVSSLRLLGDVPRLFLSLGVGVGGNERMS